VFKEEVVLGDKLDRKEQEPQMRRRAQQYTSLDGLYAERDSISVGNITRERWNGATDLAAVVLAGGSFRGVMVDTRRVSVCLQCTERFTDC